jgi:hypothetical protein
MTIPLTVVVAISRIREAVRLPVGVGMMGQKKSECPSPTPEETV